MMNSISMICSHLPKVRVPKAVGMNQVIAKNPASAKSGTAEAILPAITRCEAAQSRNAIGSEYSRFHRCAFWATIAPPAGTIETVAIIKNTLFDFFGTLVEYSASRTEQGYERSHQLLRDFGSALDYEAFLNLWSATSEELDQIANRDLSEFSMHDVTASFLAHATGAAPTESMIDQFIAAYIEEWNKGVRYFDGLAAFLAELRTRYRLGIVTNTHLAGFVEDHLARMGVASHFDVIVTSVGEGRRKPHAKIFLRALEVMNASPGETVFVGDSYEADYLGSRAIGMECYLIDPSQSADVSASNRLSHLFDLRRCLPE